MKKVSLLALLCAMVFVGCAPTAEGETNKISRAWQINKYYENNEDKTSEFKATNKNFSLQFYPDNTFLRSAMIQDTFYTQSGTWEFSNPIDSLFLYSSTDTNRYFIRLLRPKNLNLREAIGTNLYDYLLVDY